MKLSRVAVMGYDKPVFVFELNAFSGPQHGKAYCLLTQTNAQSSVQMPVR